jgi:hypothetical protein
MDTLLEALKSYRTMAKPEAKDFSVAGPLSEIKNQKATGLVNEIKRLEDK